MKGEKHSYERGETRRIVFVDGYCNLCHRLVQILLQLDSKNKLHFSSLESSFSASFFSEEHGTILSLDSVVFYDGDELFFKSDAILKIAHTLGFPISLFEILSLIPKGFRDFIYDLIAKFRYQIFGKNSVCHITGKKECTRFLVTPE